MGSDILKLKLLPSADRSASENQQQPNVVSDVPDFTIKFNC